MKPVRDTRALDAAPFLSVVVPCHQVASVVLETLESLWQQGAYPGLECLIIDDGSRDSTLATITDWIDAGPKSGFLLLTQTNQGLSAVRNRGIEWAKGQWLAFLDSDDRVTAEGFSALWQLAETTPADLLLGGVLITEGGSKDRSLRPFYHHRLWDRLLGTRSTVLTSLEQAPALLALEPNVNYRWFRRRFYLEAGLHFPEGLLFEDLPVHFRMLRLARQIALVATPYYLYRVNRPGKITESRDGRRFDALATIGLAIDELKRGPLKDIEGAFALRSLARLGWGCGRMMPPAMRLCYFRGLVAELGRVPLIWRLMGLGLRPLERGWLGLLMVLRQPHLLALASLIERPRKGIGVTQRAKTRWIRSRDDRSD